MIRKAIIQGFDPQSYTATVQVAGSLSVWLEGVPVSRAIPPATMVPGLPCAVIFLDESNPHDAVVTAVFSTSGHSQRGWPWEHIETRVLDENATAVDFEGLSADHAAFRLLALIRRSTYGGPMSTGLRFNDDDGQNYDFRDLLADSSGVRTTLVEANTFGVLGMFDDLHYGVAFIYIQNRDATVQKEWLSFAGLGSSSLRHITGRWNNTTSRISRITVTPVIGQIYAGSMFILDGVRK